MRLPDGHIHIMAILPVIFSYRMPFCFNETHTDVTVFGNDHWFNDVDQGTAKMEPECNKEICPDPSGKIKKYVRIRDPLAIGTPGPDFI